MHRIHVGNHMPGVDQEMLGLCRGNAQYRGQLRQADDDRGGVDESHQYRVRQEVEQYTHSHQAKRHLKYARDECGASCDMLAAVSNEVIATGPVDRMPEDPNIAPITAGINAA